MALFQIDFYSEVLQMCTNMQVLLPQNVSRHGFRGETEAGYPSLLLLHGMYDDCTAWTRRTAIERYVDTTPLAVIMPSAHLSFYSDMYHGGKYETYFREELPKIIHEFFPQISQRREDTYIAGLSMGGFGAVKLALRSPERYSKAVSLSGPLDLVMQAQYVEMNDFWHNLFGSVEELKGSVNDIPALAAETAKTAAQLPEFYLWCGKDDSLFPISRSGEDALRALGYSVESHTGDGAHTWDCWDREIARAIPWLLQK